MKVYTNKQQTKESGSEKIYSSTRAASEKSLKNRKPTERKGTSQQKKGENRTERGERLYAHIWG